MVERGVKLEAQELSRLDDGESAVRGVEGVEDGRRDADIPPPPESRQQMQSNQQTLDFNAQFADAHRTAVAQQGASTKENAADEQGVRPPLRSELRLTESQMIFRGDSTGEFPVGSNVAFPSADGPLRKDIAPRTASTPSASAAEGLPPAPSKDSARVTKIWSEWLAALASDPEAAMAAALAYRQLTDDVRDEWISALQADVLDFPVSRVAVFAPMMAVETDPERRLRIAQLLQPGLSDLESSDEVLGAQDADEYLKGTLGDRAVVSMIVSPLYLDFVQVLACAYLPGERFLWVRHDPITRRDQLGAARDALSGVELEPAPARAVVDELARTIVAVHRSGGELPEALCLFAHLFAPTL